jgi:hypothetical protein
MLGSGGSVALVGLFEAGFENALISGLSRARQHSKKKMIASSRGGSATASSMPAKIKSSTVGVPQGPCRHCRALPPRVPSEGLWRGGAGRRRGAEAVSEGQPASLARARTHSLQGPRRTSHRHYLLLDAGAGPHETQQLARDADIRMTLEVYSHVRDGALRAAVERIRLPYPAPL